MCPRLRTLNGFPFLELWERRVLHDIQRLIELCFVSFFCFVNSVLHVATFKGGGQPFLFLYMGDGICGIVLCRVLE